MENFWIGASFAFVVLLAFLEGRRWKFWENTKLLCMQKDTEFYGEESFLFIERKVTSYETTVGIRIGSNFKEIFSKKSSSFS